MADRTRTQSGRNSKPHREGCSIGRFNPFENNDLLSWHWVRRRLPLAIWIVYTMGYHSEMCSPQTARVSGIGQIMCAPELGEGLIQWEHIPWKRATSTVNLQWPLDRRFASTVA